VLHHVPKEVFLTPTAEHARSKQGMVALIACTYEARLMAGFGKFSHLTNPKRIFTGTNKTFLLGQSHGHNFTVWHAHFMLFETIFRPRFFWILMVRYTRNAVIFPHLTEENRAISFPVKNHYEAAKILIGL
jgi:lysophospholipid acyltransferase (LPLAT)-like uncharacterized protein